MHPSQSLDLLVKERLKQWPQRPPGVKAAALGRDSWLRGRPSDDVGYHPFLKLPGSTRWRTLPDGLWLNFGGTPDGSLCGHLCDRGLRVAAEPAGQALALRPEHALAAGRMPGAVVAVAR